MQQVGEAVTLLAAALLKHERPPSKAQCVQVMFLGLTWSSIALLQVSAWHCYFGSSLLQLLSEVVLIALSASGELKSVVGSVEFGLQCVRLLVLAGLAATALRLAFRRGKAKDEEVEPLLPGDESNGDAAAGSYGTEEPSESDDESDDRYTKIQQKKRLEQSGDWWTYLKGFSIFIPYLIPRNDRKVQLCLAITVVCLLAQRALNILVPRQFGIITNRLVAGGLPISELGIWLLLQTLEGRSGLGLVERIVKIPIDQFSYRQITNAAFTHVMNLSIDFHNDKDSAEVMKAVEQGESLNNLLDAAITTIGPTLFDLMIGYVYFYQVFDIYVSFLVMAASICFLFLDLKTANWNLDNRRAWQKCMREESKVMHQAVQGWQTVSYFNQFDHEKTHFAGAVHAAQASSLKWTVKDSYRRALLEAVVPLAFFGVCLMVIFQVSRGEASPGDFVFLLQYWPTLTYPLRHLSSHYRWLMLDLIDAERLLVLFQTKPTITDKEDAKPLKVREGKVAFRHVHFAYDPRKPTLEDINAEARNGQTVALVGETGGGKSTMLKLLYRFYDVSQGSIEIDGQDLRDVSLESLRNALGVVPQDPALFNTTIMENLRYARMDATDEDIYDACRAAAVHDKILTFPDKYQSTVGERGVKLSGGELQRVAIARVLLKNPAIVLLDEATSSVDTDTEASIQAAFKKLSTGRTTFVIAHRLSTIVKAEQILVFHQGKVIERGTHQGLLRQKGKYHGLWSKQIASNEAGPELERETPETREED